MADSTPYSSGRWRSLSPGTIPAGSPGSPEHLVAQQPSQQSKPGGLNASPGADNTAYVFPHFIHIVSAKYPLLRIFYHYIYVFRYDYEK